MELLEERRALEAKKQEETATLEAWETKKGEEAKQITAAAIETQHCAWLEQQQPIIQDSKPIGMDGVHEYLPVETMTEEERARKRAVKRGREPMSSLKAAVSAEQNIFVEQDDEPMSHLKAAVSTENNVVVEQDDDVLFDGVPGIWDSKYTATTQTTFDVNPLPETGDGHGPVVDHATQMEFDAL